MKEIKFWDSSLSNKCKYLTTFEEMISYIKENKIDFNFLVHDTFTPGNYIRENLDRIVQNKQTTIIYSDEDHPIVVPTSTSLISNILINSHFFNSHREKFIFYMKEELQKN